MEVYAIEYAPDGEHYSVFKKGKVGEMWDYFVMEDRIIGALKFDREKREFLHLRE
jgi:hypothetical protein